MKSGIHFALISMLASSVPATAAEISAAECSAIRGLAKDLAQTNLETSKSLLAAQKAIMGLMVDSLEAPALRAKLTEISDTLKTRGMDKAVLVSGLTALNKVCPQ